MTEKCAYVSVSVCLYYTHVYIWCVPHTLPIGTAASAIEYMYFHYSIISSIAKVLY